MSASKPYSFSEFFNTLQQVSALQELNDAISSQTVSGITSDSRKVKPGFVFVALTGIRPRAAR